MLSQTSMLMKEFTGTDLMDVLQKNMNPETKVIVPELEREDL